MSSTYTLTPSNLLEYYSTERLEKLLNNLIEPHPDIIWNTFEQVLLAETRQEPFTETFYHWVNTTLNTEDLDTLYSYLENEYFQYEPPSTDDYEDEWTEISTQQSRRNRLGIWDQSIRSLKKNQRKMSETNPEQGPEPMTKDMMKSPLFPPTNLSCQSVLEDLHYYLPQIGWLECNNEEDQKPLDHLHSALKWWPC